MRAFFKLPVLLLATIPILAEDPLVVIAASRSGFIEFYSDKLTKLGSIAARDALESVTASADGRMLFAATQTENMPGSSLYSLDLPTRNLCFLTAPALIGLPSPNGNYLFAQGAHGVDVFDHSLNRLTTMKAHGTYNLLPSPDGEWLFGIANSPKPSLDIFDVVSMTLARRLPIPASPVTGAWAGDRFYLFNYAGTGFARLWNVAPGDRSLQEAAPVLLPDLHSGCKEPVLLSLAGGPDRLFLAEAFGFKLDRRTACPDAAAGGIHVIQISSGRVTLLAKGVHVNRMAVTPDGRDLYAIESGRHGDKKAVDLLHVDTRNGEVSRISLQAGQWNLALSHIPIDLVPRSIVPPASVCHR